MCLALVAGLSALSGRLVYLQWDAGDDSKASSPGRSIKRPLLAQNGYIVDRNEEVIARNNPVTEISVDLNHLTDPKVVAPGVAYARAVLREEWPNATEIRKDQIVGALSDEILETRRGVDIVQQHLSLLASILTPYLKEYEHRDDLLKKVGPVDKRLNRPSDSCKKSPRRDF